MPNAKKLVIPITQLAMKAVELRDEGFNRFRFRIYPKDKRIVELSAWRYKEKEETQT